ncbi:hypothetical protein ACFFV7_31650 [Nonomuraea spiralis]|uniref:P68 RBP/TagC-like beta-propeller domain-containing protein n=1 Tax=Nonomuraea spiralis TaxID=46182 RepID=A0ABV5IP04_9ACTN|nr:teichoic acid biosynthesis protein C [Nonomuraea spiralis]GGT00207.1 hypothetical protein GCM10010176_050180 [Nonomuraea spiralis]
MAPLSRRDALRLGATAALAAAMPLSPSPAVAVSSGTDAQSLDTAGRVLLRGGRLLHSTVLQSFAFDERNGHLYALQLMQGGVRLDAERGARTHAQRARRGDLCLNRLTLDGVLTGTMYLLGFGHGGALGVQRTTGGDTVVWTEWDASPASGYGRGICRFPFVDGAVLTSATRGLTVYRPLPGSTSNAPTVDPGTGRLLLRYKLAGTPRFRLLDTGRLAAGDLRPLADLPQPGAGLGLPFQGMALRGDHAYQLLGSAYGPANPRSSRGNIRLYRLHLPSGKVEQHFLDATARDLVPREPEGLAVLVSPGAGPLLCMGLTRGPVRDKSFSLYARPVA